MLETPRKYTLVAGASEGRTRLNAFDNALLVAGIGNINLLKVSSIMPPHAVRCERVDVKPGTLVPTAYGAIESEISGQMISAAVGVGLGADDDYGVIMEFSGRCGRAEAEAEVELMLQLAFAQRNLTLRSTEIRAVEHRVDRIGCALAAVALWY